MKRIVLIRHGESQWNKENRFTGWTNVDLSEKGVQEAFDAGKILKENGFTTAGALDTWCIDKESSISLLRSAIRFHRLTGSPEYIEDALAISYYLSTWLWHYDGIYPESDDFSEYGYHTFGATSVSVQHNHLDPYALYWVPEWMELSELTGDSQWKEKAVAIWRNSNQLVSDGTLEIHGHLRPAGSQNEAYFECAWGDYSHRVNDWLVAWPGAFRLETIRRLEGFSSNPLSLPGFVR